MSRKRHRFYCWTRSEQLKFVLGGRSRVYISCTILIEPNGKQPLLILKEGIHTDAPPQNMHVNLPQMIEAQWLDSMSLQKIVSQSCGIENEHHSGEICWWCLLNPFHDIIWEHVQWLFLVPIKGGRQQITPEKAIYKWYISGIYIAKWVIICYLPPFMGTRKLHWHVN